MVAGPEHVSRLSSELWRLHSQVFVDINVTSSNFEATVTILDNSPTRLPEAAFITFNPKAAGNWANEILGISNNATDAVPQLHGGGDDGEIVEGTHDFESGSHGIEELRHVVELTPAWAWLPVLFELHRLRRLRKDIFCPVAELSHGRRVVAEQKSIKEHRQKSTGAVDNCLADSD